MIWRSRLMRVALLMALTNLCAGCRAMMATFGQKTPYAEGTWTGRLLSVEVEDQAGQRHQAAALLIESGPRTLSSPGGTTGPIAEGTVPYLMKFGASVIVDPKQLGLPEGARIRVRGRMKEGLTGVSVEHMPGKHNVIRRIKRVSGEQPYTPVMIWMRGKPKVLKE